MEPFRRYRIANEIPNAEPPNDFVKDNVVARIMVNTIMVIQCMNVVLFIVGLYRYYNRKTKIHLNKTVNVTFLP